jgi:hypothetical protein
MLTSLAQKDLSQKNEKSGKRVSLLGVKLWDKLEGNWSILKGN